MEILKVSVVLPTHSNYCDCVEAIQSILSQKYGNLELIVIVDHNPGLYRKLTKTFQGWTSKVRFILTPKHTSLSESRNLGAKVATGDVVVFTDDDIIVDEYWIKNIVKAYKKYKAVGVSGKVVPLWKDKPPKYLADEFLWLVGCTYRGFCNEELCKVRNGIGPNFSFKREVFNRVGYFNENLGFANKGRRMLQGEEAEFSIRVIRDFGNRIIHTNSAIVYHKVPARKTRIIYLLKRSFWQGYSKAVLEHKSLDKDKDGHVLDIERGYLINTINSIRNRPTLVKIANLAIIISVGIGYLVGKIMITDKRSR